MRSRDLAPSPSDPLGVNSPHAAGRVEGLARRSFAEAQADLSRRSSAEAKADGGGGFTLVELVVVLTIMVVLLGLVIVRVGGWTPRQRLSASARALGNTIRTFRERAELEERVYVLTLDSDAGTYAVATEAERGPFRLGEMEEVRKGRLEAGQAFARFQVGETERSGLLILHLTPKGVGPATRITIRGGHDEEVTLGIGALVNEIEYSEAQ